MTMDELLASYDPIDMEYKNMFPDMDGYQEVNKGYSFIPDEEELDKIFIIPARRIRGVEAEETE